MRIDVEFIVMLSPPQRKITAAPVEMDTRADTASTATTTTTTATTGKVSIVGLALVVLLLIQVSCLAAQAPESSGS